MAALLGFVAINTLVFLGLSVAKVVPWPHPLHPHLLHSRVPTGPGVASAAQHAPAASLSLRQNLLLLIVVLSARLIRSTP